jgi:beta-galactosidase
MTEVLSHHANFPEIGSQVWIEPGQTNEDIAGWFKILSDHHIYCARLFIMWNYVEVKPDFWDFTLYDQAFDVAEKYGIKIQATLTANHGPAYQDEDFWYHNQGAVILKRRKQLADAEKYIHRTVKHFMDHPALENWWLQNEPGENPDHDELAMERFRIWLKEKYGTIDKLNDSWITNFISFDHIEYHCSWDGLPGFYAPQPYHDWNIFWRDHLTWFMRWITDQIRKNDTVHPIHVNPHAVFDFLPRYDLPAWRNFLSSLGASIHPSWHFDILKKEQYAMGVSAVCQIIHGAIEPKPFWISELQGGNNIFSSLNPLYPIPDDIGQWVWTGIGSGADKVIFWCLNARRTGNEAGEWSMLDYQGNPSERLNVAAEIAFILEKHKEFFTNARPVQSSVTIILSPETMLVEARQDHFSDIPGRKSNAHVLSALAFYETLSELGLSPQIKQANDFNWSDNESAKKMVILPNMTCISSNLVNDFEAFVSNGNKLIITGLTGYFDEFENNVVQTGFPLQNLVGGTIKDIKLVQDIFHYRLYEMNDHLPVHMWETEILPDTGRAEGKSGDKIIALRNQFGKGEVIWIPAMIGLGAWLDDNSPLANLLIKEGILDNEIFFFGNHYPGLFMKILKNENEYLFVIVNQKEDGRDISIKSLDYVKTEFLCGKMISGISDTIHIGASETLVFRYITD